MSVTIQFWGSRISLVFVFLLLPHYTLVDCLRDFLGWKKSSLITKLRFTELSSITPLILGEHVRAHTHTETYTFVDFYFTIRYSDLFDLGEKELDYILWAATGKATLAHFWILCNPNLTWLGIFWQGDESIATYLRFKILSPKLQRKLPNLSWIVLFSFLNKENEHTEG